MKKIRWLSGGFPFLIARWLMQSKDLRISELAEGREGYCRFIEWCFEGLSDKCLLFLRRISVLSQPLSVGDYERLTGIRTGECNLLLEKLEKKRILIKQNYSFWFRHDLIKPCVESKLSQGEIHLYHMDAAKFFERDINYQEKEKQPVEFRLMLCCAYHFHYAREYEESIYYNEIASNHSHDIGDLDVAETCYLRTIEAAQKLGKMDTMAVAKGNVARIYHFLGRVDEAYRTHEENREYFHKTKDQHNEAISLNELGGIEYYRGNLDEAAELHNKSLKISRELGDKSAIAKSLNNLGMIEHGRGNLDKAAELYNQSLKISRELGDKSAIANSLDSLSVILTKKNQLEKALE
ncbi:MAG: tetratricopeptide repeat protein [Candidatus Hodarchaeota archaeon]